jgi:hypothetical protein
MAESFAERPFHNGMAQDPAETSIRGCVYHRTQGNSGHGRRSRPGPVRPFGHHDRVSNIHEKTYHHSVV